MQKNNYSDEFITQDLEKGGRFVQFTNVIFTPYYRKRKSICYIPSDSKSISKGWPHLLASFFKGLFGGIFSDKEKDVTDSIKKARLMLRRRFHKNYTYSDTIHTINQDFDRYADLF
ncbi:MAG: hypothetical protein IIV24_06905 [Alistipes sp.]|nr:hypothetical protein [Alistipes sp.]